MRWLWLVWMLGGASVVSAAPVEVCQTVDISTWTQEQKNLLAATAIEVIDKAGSPSTLTTWSNKTGQLCFDRPTVDLALVLTPAALLAQLAVDDAARASSQRIEKARQDGFTTELDTNTICTAELDNIDLQVDALLDSTVTLDDAKAAMKKALKQIARCVRAKAR